jgi:hypothetical protein
MPFIAVYRGLLRIAVMANIDRGSCDAVYRGLPPIILAGKIHFY